MAEPGTSILLVDVDLRSDIERALLPDEKVLSVGRYDMAFIHGPGGKHFFLFCCQLLAISIFVVWNSGWTVMFSAYSRIFSNIYCYLALALVVAVQVWHRSIKRAMVVTDKRILLAYRLPFARVPRVETYALSDVVKANISRSCGIQDAAIRVKVGSRKVFIDCSELSNAQQIIDHVRSSGSSSPPLIEKQE